jgi:ABC-type transporter Mla maintaining outer membrane lipid asymmetry permease subunit MlaE
MPQHIPQSKTSRGYVRPTEAPRMAAGVGKATTEAVVVCFVLILVWDYFITSVMLETAKKQFHFLRKS